MHIPKLLLRNKTPGQWWQWWSVWEEGREFVGQKGGDGSGGCLRRPGQQQQQRLRWTLLTAVFQTATTN